MRKIETKNIKLTEDSSVGVWSNYYKIQFPSLVIKWLGRQTLHLSSKQLKHPVCSQIIHSKLLKIYPGSHKEQDILSW